MTDDFNPDDLHPDEVVLDPDLTSEMTRLRPIIEQEEADAAARKNALARTVAR